jgi:hypothetical protein
MSTGLISKVGDELYRAYIIGDDGRIIGFNKIKCRNDTEALQKVSRLVYSKRVEVWTGPRLVTVLRNESQEGNTSAP